MKYILTVTFSLCMYFSVAQDRIDSALSVLSEKYPQEQIYIAYNQSNYIAGETIWFKCFVLLDQQQTDISTNLCVELLDQHKHIIQKKYLPIIQGIAESQIALPDTLSENIYFIRAYTNWMLNFKEEFQYIEPITIYNPNSVLKLKKKQSEIEAAVFVESGNFIANVPNQIVCRFYSEDTVPIKWSGYIIDSLNPNVKISNFESINKNLATLSFTPTEPIHYQVILESVSEKIKTINLPMVKSAGISFQVHQSDSILTYSGVFSNIAKGSTYKLKGTINNNLVYKAIINNNDGFFTRSFSTTSLPMGILRLSLFDSADQIVAERLCFLSPKTEKEIQIDSILINSNAKATNSFQISADSGYK